MARMNDPSSQVQNPYSKSDHYGSRSISYGQPIPRSNYSQAYSMQQGQNNANMAALAQGFGAMNMHEASYTPQGKTVMMNGTQYNALGLNTAMSPALWGSNHQMMFQNGHGYPPASHTHSATMYSPMGPQYMAHGFGQAHDNSTLSQGWTPGATTDNIPTLITPRRDSMSSGENDAPGTPSYGTYTSFPNGGVTIVNRSPNGTYTTSTPSPLHMMTQYGIQVAKLPDTDVLPPRLQMIVSKEPSIPPAVPAPSSPLKPLDRALENIRGETNVYIRGLLPETSDAMLEDWGRRFGDIKSSKSIIDHSTGLCKGYVIHLAFTLLMVHTDTQQGSALSDTTTTRKPRTAFVAFTTLDTKSALLGSVSCLLVIFPC